RAAAADRGPEQGSGGFPAGTGLPASAILFVDRGPGDALGIFLRAALLALALLDMRRLALLLVGVGGLVSAAHGELLLLWVPAYPRGPPITGSTTPLT